MRPYTLLSPIPRSRVLPNVNRTVEVAKQVVLIAHVEHSLSGCPIAPRGERVLFGSDSELLALRLGSRSNHERAQP